MAEKINFYLAQYLNDPIRREPKNVGLFVGRNGEWAGRFLGGEKLDGETDLRTITWTEHPKIYRKWVRYWREELETGGEDFLARVMETNGGNYDVIHGGHIAQAGSDTAAQIVANLFPMLVLEPKQEAKLDEEDGDGEIVNFRAAVNESFRSLGIFSGWADEAVKRPIYPNAHVKGKRVTHVPAYMQTGADCVMEVLNFSTRNLNPAKDHAGWAATMFDDLRRENSKLKTIALVQATPDELKLEKVQYSLKLLGDSVSETVYWIDNEQRKEFLEARRAEAYRASA